jgi:hypothetical protein
MAGKIIINNKADILTSKALGFVSDMIDQYGLEDCLYPKYHEFNIDNLHYTIIAKRGSGSFIYTIEYTGYEHEIIQEKGNLQGR